MRLQRDHRWFVAAKRHLRQRDRDTAKVLGKLKEAATPDLRLNPDLELDGGDQ
jgi:hypothetical protein